MTGVAMQAERGDNGFRWKEDRMSNQTIIEMCALALHLATVAPDEEKSEAALSYAKSLASKLNAREIEVAKERAMSLTSRWEA